MTIDDFAGIIASNLPYAPNHQQSLVIGALARFCSSMASAESVFILNGFAGTGKTSLCGALVKSLPSVGLSAVLLAPTGRAAKVFSKHSGRTAYTIHRRIYRHPGVADALSGAVGRMVAENRNTNTIFIVDEASMISGDEASGGDLLADLIHYVYTGHNCRMILLGDTAQLPPVGCEFSPALSDEVLRSFGLKVSRATLTEIARQGAKSGILYNATRLRRAMKLDPLPLPDIRTDFPDVAAVSGQDMVEEMYSAYARDGVAETIVVTRSNSRAAGINREIRASVLYYERVIEPGELMIVAKNNYFWTRSRKDIDFIANGDVVEVVRIISTETKYMMRFADVELSMPDSDVTLTAKVMLDVLDSETATLPVQQMQQLYLSIINDPTLFSPMTPIPDRQKALADNPYWNALQVKYGYCVTCHKAQGGQWQNVFVDMGYIPPEAMGLDFYRWLYTAVSRARSRLYFLGLNE